MIDIIKKILRSASAYLTRGQPENSKPMEAVFSPSWLAEHASPQSREEFEKSCGAVATCIYHITDLESAASIWSTRMIYGIDVRNSAHFHHHPNGASRQAQKSGAMLGFTWTGPVVKVDLATNLSTHVDRRPNILFDVPISQGSETWEMRLYPGSTGLPFAFIEISGIGYRLRQPLELMVGPGA